MDTRLLVVASPKKRDELVHFLESGDWEVHTASTLPEFHRELTGPGSFDVALIDMDFADGSWKDVMDILTSDRHSCTVIVCCRQAAEQLWAEVVGQGAYDLLVEPYEKQEVLRLVQSALDRMNLHRLAQLKAS